MNPIGVHFIPTHTGKFHYDFIRDMQPSVLKLVGSSAPDVQQIADGYAAAPNALIYLRNVARSEQHDFLWRDPKGAARQHVDEWHADMQRIYQQGRERGLALPTIEQIRILGVNEPVIELFARKEDMSNYDAWLAMMNERAPKLDEYMTEFGDDANAFGYGTGLGNISSGQPANKKPGEYATFDWFPRTRRLLESTRGLNAYTCHEYWRAETGPEGHADWHAWRFMHLNVDCDIDVLESGVDQKITDAPMNGNRGWRGHMEAPAYVDQHRRYIARAITDSRFRWETPFTLDGDKIWESFWIEYCMAEMVALSSELRASTPPQPDDKPFELNLPAIGTGTQPTPTPTYVYVIAPAGARVRASASTASAILANIPYGEQIRVIGVGDNNWFRVQVGDVEGWMAASVVGLSEPEPLPDPVPAPAPSQPPTPTAIIDPITALAFLQVESANVAFRDGLLTIRFEVHRFKANLKNDSLFDMHFKFTPGNYSEQYWRPTPNAAWINAHGPMDERHRLLAFARGLNDSAALHSTGMGLAQVMGENHARVGYATPQAMFNAFKHPRFGVNAQIMGFVNYVLSDPALADALRRQDWWEAITKYNGDGQQAYYLEQLDKALATIRQEIGA